MTDSLRAVPLLLALAGPAAAQPLAVEPIMDASFLAVRLDKGGLFSAFAGHQHGILATDWSAEICFDRAQPQSLHVAFSVAVPALRIDSPEARRRAGLEPDNGPGEDDVATIQEKMLAPENLAARDHPAIRFEGRRARVRGEGRLDLSGDLTIRGQTREVTIPVAYRLESDSRVVFSGSVTLEQSDFGIKPVSIAGVVKVKDSVTASFQIAGSFTDRKCGP